MREEKNVITLYPSNWLYNAGVVGLLRIYEKMGFDVTESLREDGTAKFKIDLSEDDIFNVWDGFTNDIFKQSYKGKKGGTQKHYYSNQIESSIIQKIKKFKSTCQLVKSKRMLYCSICGRKETPPQKLKRSFLTQAYSNILLASEKTFPNSYWNLVSNNYVCSKCDFVLLCHHIGLTEISSDKGQTHIFINSPKFKEMFYLNKLIDGIAGSSNLTSREIREILAMSVIEYATKLKSTLGLWSTMNIEIVHKYKIKNEKGKLEDRIEFFSLPFDVVKIVSDRNISNILSDLAEFKILNIILDGKYSFLTEIGYELLREGIKDYNNRNEKLINSILYQHKNQINPISTANKILKLYSLIEDKLKRN